MSGDISNGDLMQVLLDIKGDVGALKGSSAMQLDGLKNHSERIGALEASNAKQKGFLTALTSVGSVMGAGVGYLIERVTFGHHG